MLANFDVHKMGRRVNMSAKTQKERRNCDALRFFAASPRVSRPKFLLLLSLTSSPSMGKEFRDAFELAKLPGEVKG